MGSTVLFVLLLLCGMVLHEGRGQEYNVSDCPRTCECVHPSVIQGVAVRNGVVIRHCEDDPFSEIMRIIHTFPNMDGLQLTDTLSHSASKTGSITRLFRKLSQLVSLKVLDISNNKLSELPDTMGDLPVLSLFNVSNNNLTTLPIEVITAQVIDASQNRITSLDISSLDRKPHREFYFSNNDIASLNNIPAGADPKWKILDLSNNRLTSIDAWFCRLGVSFANKQYSIRVLNMSHNYIFRFTNVNGYSSLPSTYQLWCKARVDISHNDIGMRPVNIPDGLKSGFAVPFGRIALPLGHRFKSFWVLDLSYNRIQHLHDVVKFFETNQDMFAFFILNEHVNLEGNPLICDCTDYTLYKKLKTQSNTPALACGAPQALKGRSIATVHLDQFRCTPKSDCPDGCFCTDIPNQDLMVVNCHNYTGKTLPQRIPSPHTNTSKFRYTLDFEGGSLVNLVNWDYLQWVENASFRDNHLKHIPPGFFDEQKKFHILRLDNNNIETLPLYIKRWPESLYLSHNKWRCTCENQNAIQQIRRNKVSVPDYQYVHCSSPGSLKDKSVDEMACFEISRQNVLQTKLIVPLIIVCTLFIGGVLAVGVAYAKRVWIYRMFRWHPFHRADATEAEKEFDIFVSYNDLDDYVEDHLLPRLEELGFKLCHHRENFLAGESIIWNIHRAIMGSKRTLIFFSQDYMNRGLCMYEFYTALTLQVKEGCSHLVTIKDTNIDVKTLEIGLQSFFEHYTYIELDSPKFWDNLLYDLPVVRLNAPAAENAA